MSLFSRAKKFGKEAANIGAGVLWDQIQRRFPGISQESLKKGWISVSASYLEAELCRRTNGVEGLESVSLTCVPDYFKLHLDTSKHFFKHEIDLDLTCDAFLLNTQEKRGTFACSKNIEIRGRNVLGKLSAWLARALILRAIMSTDTAEEVRQTSEGAFELQWPKIIVHLDQIEKVRKVIDCGIANHTILDFVNFGPLLVKKDRVRLKISRGPILTGRGRMPAERM